MIPPSFRAAGGTASIGNEKPIFAQKDVEFVYCRVMGSAGNMGRILARTPEGENVELIIFRNIDRLFKTIDKKYGEGTGDRLKKQRCSGVKMDIIYYPDINEYQGRKSIQFIINDYR